MSSASASSKPFSLNLGERDALIVAAMSAAVALPVDAFLGQVVSAWLEKPRNFKRLAKRVLEKTGGKAAAGNRARARKLARALKRDRIESGEAKGAGKKAKKTKRNATAGAAPAKKKPAGTKAAKAAKAAKAGAAKAAAPAQVALEAAARPAAPTLVASA